MTHASKEKGVSSLNAPHVWVKEEKQGHIIGRKGRE
jgi:predicted RNA-binding protein YlqC (UPF0109 family)